MIDSMRSDMYVIEGVQVQPVRVEQEFGRIRAPDKVAHSRVRRHFRHHRHRREIPRRELWRSYSDQWRFLDSL